MPIGATLLPNLSRPICARDNVYESSQSTSESGVIGSTSRFGLLGLQITVTVNSQHANYTRAKTFALTEPGTPVKLIGAMCKGTNTVHVGGTS